ncbi:MAG: hypothetical protein QM820_37870 [Minicystis sp.]
MASDRTHDTSTFDALWDFDLDEGKDDDLPPALDPNPRKLPPEKRDTLLPPVPQPDYVQTMMELGELDDPSGAARVSPPPPPKPKAPPPKPKAEAEATRDPTRTTTARLQNEAKLGLVMATEHELLLPMEAASAEPEPVPAARPFGTPAVRPGTVMPPKGAAKSGGFRTSSSASSLGRGAPVIPGAPIPRAPSVPPPALDEGDPLAGLESLDALDGPPPAILVGRRPLSETPVYDGAASGPKPPAPAGPFYDGAAKSPAGPFYEGAARSPAPPSPFHDASTLGTKSRAPTGPAPRFTPGIPPRRTPPIPPDGRAPSSGGLRLRKTGPPPEEADRITPVAIEPAFALDAADLIEVEPAPNSVLEQVREMQQRFEARNYSGALVLAESVLVSDPTHAVARRTAESCREMLAEKYLTSLGGRRSVPRVAMSPEEMRFQSLDHRAGFLLSFIDGSMSIEEVLDVSSMPELEALRIMFELRQQGVIEIETPAPRPGRK